MNRHSINRREGAFSLIELLCVIAIIGILAAMLLPVLNKAKERGKLIYCASDLRQTGIAFISFSHDHDGSFPTKVPMANGGSQEFVQNGYLVNGEFYFAFRNFQPLSNDLVAPQILICPADLARQPTNSFAALQNLNLSYFIGVNADFSRPLSILAGDRNLVIDSPNPSIFYAWTNSVLRWTREMHQSRGNLLFADGHVEEPKELAPADLADNGAGRNDFFIPTVPAGQDQPGQPGLMQYPVGNPTGPGGAGGNPTYPGNPYSGPGATPGSAPNIPPNYVGGGHSMNPQKGSQPIHPQYVPYAGDNAVNVQGMSGDASAAPVAAPALTDASAMPSGSSNRQPATMGTNASPMSAADQRIAQVFRNMFEWGYFLALLFLLLLFIFELWRRKNQRENQKRKRRLKR